MVQFKAIIEKFASMGEKSGWTYITIPSKLAQQLKPGFKKSFRVKGSLDKLVIKNVALLPMGEGDFIMALNAAMRKVIKKSKGEELLVRLKEDNAPALLNTDLIQCLKDDDRAFQFFETLAPGHRRYFSNWIENAKTEATKAKRIGQAITALSQKQDFGQMIRSLKEVNKLISNL